MSRFVPTLSMPALVLATAFASAQAEVAAQPEPAAFKTTFSASPITPGFWQFLNVANTSSDTIVQSCRNYVTFQFQDGYYFMLRMKNKAPESIAPRLSFATVHEVGRCTFDRKSQSERCDVAVTDDANTNKGFIDIRYSREKAALKMSIKATDTEGPNAGKTASFERFPVKCPDNIVHDLMIPARR
jgi:hypothetical protein